MKNYKLLFLSILISGIISSCNKKNKNDSIEIKPRKFVWGEHKNNTQTNNYEELIIGKWKNLDALEQDGVNIVFKGTDHYLENKEVYSQGVVIVGTDQFYYSMKGKWKIENSYLYFDCENVAGSIKNILPDYNCELINTMPPRKIVKITDKELHYKDDEGMTNIDYKFKP